MASLVAETQLEKDVASKAGVIPIHPWLKDGKTKDGLPPNIYANMLLQEKRANGEEGIIRRCDHDGCEHDTKSMFWRSADTAENIVPEGWTDFGGIGHFTYCPTCRASDIEDIGLDEDREDWRVDINLKHGSTGSSGASDKPLRTYPGTPVLPPRPPQKYRSTNMELKARARELWKNHPEHLEAALQEIDKEERKKRANAAESRKRKRTGGKRRRKKRTKKRRKSRRRKRRKSRRRKRR